MVHAGKSTLCTPTYLSEFSGDAVLSHTGASADDETTLQDFQTGSKRDTAGWKKIAECRRLANEHGLKFFWITTCCIEKTSSAELSETIYLMYALCERSTICFSFLSDLGNEAGLRLLPQCRWFRPGWTAQELLAPNTMLSYSRRYQRMGSENTLGALLAGFTGHPSNSLLHAKDWLR